MIKIHLACLSYFIVADVVRCKPDYMFNEDAGGWLKLHRTPATWEEAFLRCHYEGAVLASPLNKQLANALHTLVIESDVDYIFLGTHDLFAKGDFVSVEGVPLSDLEIRWGRNYIGIATGNCLILSSTVPYVMYASSCTKPLPYICYRKLDNLTMNECGTYDNDYHFKQSTGSCYKAHYEEQTWSSAYRICAAEGAYLTVLNDNEEAHIVNEMFPTRDGNVNLWEKFHIGLLAWGEDRTWITIHGDRVEDVFHGWNPGQPDNYGGNQDHATFLRDGTLDDNSAKTKAMFVCEKSPESIRFETLPQAIDERLYIR